MAQDQRERATLTAVQRGTVTNVTAATRWEEGGKSGNSETSEGMQFP